MKHWAENELRTLYGTTGEGEGPPHSEMDHMDEAVARLATFHPRTMRGAWQMMDVLITILMHREVDPELTLSSGPVLQLAQRVKEAIEFVDGDTPLYPEAA